MTDNRSYSSASVSISAVVDLNPSPSALQVYQRIIREWAGHLTMYELVLALTIADRTIGWRKTRATFSTVKMREGDNMYSGLPMGRSAMFEALASLEEKGIIRRYPIAARYIRSYSINIGWSPAMLNATKRLPNQSATRTVGSATRTTTVRHTDTGEGSHGEGIQEKVVSAVSASPRPAPTAIEDVRPNVATAAAATRARRAEKAQTLPDRVAGVEAAWRAALEEAHPEASFAAWSVREKAQVKAKIKTWIVKDGPMPEFVDWAVRNWAAVIAKQFRWMTKSPAPKVPEIGFLLSFLGQFLECRSEGKLDAWLAAPERTEFEKLTARGASPEEAAAEIGKSRAVMVMREEIVRADIQARARVRRAEIIEKRTELTANLPVHPDSEVARK
ncbi:MAG TPA: hypothetical protein VF695_15825, partial [Sphingomonas sp.]